VIKLLGRFFLKIIGWKVAGDFPYHIKKKIILAAPHTSNWDFPIGILIRTQLAVPIKFIGKASLFKPPFGWIFRWLGGIPVDRTKSTNFVDATVTQINSFDELTILISGEGSRRKVDRFKTGFYYMAHLAQIPIIPMLLDADNKEFRFLDPYYPTGNADVEIKELENMFKGIKGIKEENSFYPNRLESESK